MLKTKLINEIYEMPVYTDEGTYFGDIEEAILVANKVFGWRIKASKASHLGKSFSGKGVIIPHRLVKSIGDVMLISKGNLPSFEGEATE